MKKVLVLEDESSIRSFFFINLRRPPDQKPYPTPGSANPQQLQDKTARRNRCSGGRCYTVFAAGHAAASSSLILFCI